MKTTFSLLFVVCAIILFSNCTATKKTTGTSVNEPMARPTFTYEKDVAPILQASCAPCHFPETGKKKPLDSYDAVSKNMDDILARVQLPIDHDGYMPFKSKKPALTQPQIELLKKWQQEKMPK